MTTQNIFDRFVKWHVKHFGYTRLNVYGVIVTGYIFLENGKISDVGIGKHIHLKEIFGEDAYSKYAYDLWHF